MLCTVKAPSSGMITKSVSRSQRSNSWPARRNGLVAPAMSAGPKPITARPNRVRTLSTLVIPPETAIPMVNAMKAASPAKASRVPIKVMTASSTTLGASAKPLTSKTPSTPMTAAMIGSSSAAEPNIARRYVPSAMNRALSGEKRASAKMPLRVLRSTCGVSGMRQVLDRSPMPCAPTTAATPANETSTPASEVLARSVA